MNEQAASKQPPKGVMILLAVLAVLYVLVGPWVGKQLGIDLPGLGPSAEQAAGDGADAGENASEKGATGRGGPDTKAGGADANGAAPGKSPTKRPPTKSPAKRTAGQLRNDGRVQVSPAGLRYGPGSAEGTRLKHVLRHGHDMPDRDVHGVFDDGGQDEIVALIDEAYLKAQRGGRDVHSRLQSGRTVYTIDLRRRIGFVGGRAGKRNDHPPVTKVRLVLQGKDVITAYPLD